MSKSVITEDHRPQTESDLIGNPKAIAQLKSVMEDGKKALVHGEPGIGKNSAVYALAADLGFSVHEINASDSRRKEELESLYQRTLSKGFRKHLYLLDEIDGLKNWTMVEKILSHSRHVIILIANDAWVIPKKVRDMCTEVRFYKPRIQEVVKKIKEISKAEGIDADYSGVGTDVRSSINASFYGGERRESKDMFTKIDRIMRGGGDLSDINKDDLIWILDNLHNYYSGRDLFEALRVLSIASKGDVRALKLLPKGKGKIEYPYTLRRRKMMKSE